MAGSGKAKPAPAESVRRRKDAEAPSGKEDLLSSQVPVASTAKFYPAAIRTIETQRLMR